LSRVVAQERIVVQIPHRQRSPKSDSQNAGSSRTCRPWKFGSRPGLRHRACETANSADSDLLTRIACNILKCESLARDLQDAAPTEYLTRGMRATSRPPTAANDAGKPVGLAAVIDLGEGSSVTRPGRSGSGLARNRGRRFRGLPTPDLARLGKCPCTYR